VIVLGQSNKQPCPISVIAQSTAETKT